MKFLCNTEFYHSGEKLYSTGVVYSEITAKVAEQLISLDKSKTLGALSYFTPVDEEAVNFIKEKKGKLPEQTSEDETDSATRQPTKAELVRIAKDLGIQDTGRMNVEQLKEVIAAAKKPQTEQAAQQG